MAFGSFTYKQTKQLADETSAGLVLTMSDLHGDAITFDVSSDVMCVYKRSQFETTFCTVYAQATSVSRDTC